MDMLPKIVIVVGPTASGKTACGVEIAKKFNGEVIAVDSRTIYRGMDIGTAKPPAKKIDNNCFDVDGVVHWGFDLVNPDEKYTVTIFQDYAQKKIEEITKHGKLPILVGGTMLWMDAIVDNLSFPDVPPNLKLRTDLDARDVGDLAQEYLKLDPDGDSLVDIKNKRRLIRAIEVCKETGKPFSELRRKGPKLYEALWIGMSVDRETLCRRINARVGEMVSNGLVNEAKILYQKYGSEASSMSGIGYRELCEYFGGGVTLDEALENIKTNTRRFARRQMTWWKRREEISWVENCANALDLVGKFLSS
jgi:tRNA dimethylallyltransferase